MNKKLAKELYERGDRKRKIALARAYPELLFMDVSLKFICERINRDLDFDLVTENDIKYIRHHFQPGTRKPDLSLPPAIAPIASPVKTSTETSRVTWTDPEELTKTSPNIKSKFSS